MKRFFPAIGRWPASHARVEMRSQPQLARHSLAPPVATPSALRPQLLTLVSYLWLASHIAATFAQSDPSHAPGITEPYYDGTLSVSVPGTIASRPVNEGDFVKQGQIIAALERKLEELMVSRRKLVVDTLKTELDGDRKLFETTKSVSKEVVEKKELEYRVAQVDLQTAEEQLRKRLIVAPVDGFVTDFFRDVGEDCKEQEPVVRVVDTRRCYFVSNVEAKAGYNLKVGQKANLEVETGGGTEKIQGSITFVSPVVDPASGLMRVKVLFDNANATVRPGVPGKLLLEAK